MNQQQQVYTDTDPQATLGKTPVAISPGEILVSRYQKGRSAIVIREAVELRVVAASIRSEPTLELKTRAVRHLKPVKPRAPDTDDEEALVAHAGAVGRV